MTTKITVSVAASNLVVSNPLVRQNNVVAFGGGIDGTATAGTITLLAKSPGSANFETPKDSSGSDLNTIDIASPEKLNIPTKIQEYYVTVTGFSGTATNFYLVLDSTY